MKENPKEHGRMRFYWLAESVHKRSLEDDKACLRWLSSYLEGNQLQSITRDVIDELAEKNSARELNIQREPYE